jgi:hypothetical protein
MFKGIQGGNELSYKKKGVFAICGTSNKTKMEMN